MFLTLKSISQHIHTSLARQSRPSPERCCSFRSSSSLTADTPRIQEYTRRNWKNTNDSRSDRIIYFPNRKRKHLFSLWRLCRDDPQGLYNCQKIPGTKILAKGDNPSSSENPSVSSYWEAEYLSEEMAWLLQSDWSTLRDRRFRLLDTVPTAMLCDESVAKALQHTIQKAEESLSQWQERSVRSFLQ